MTDLYRVNEIMRELLCLFIKCGVFDTEINGLTRVHSLNKNPLFSHSPSVILTLGHINSQPIRMLDGMLRMMDS